MRRYSLKINKHFLIPLNLTSTPIITSIIIIITNPLTTTFITNILLHQIHLIHLVIANKCLLQLICCLLQTFNNNVLIWQYVLLVLLVWCLLYVFLWWLLLLFVSLSCVVVNVVVAVVVTNVNYISSDRRLPHMHHVTTPWCVIIIMHSF